jgi:hypothetical protein
MHTLETELNAIKDNLNLSDEDLMRNFTEEIVYSRLAHNAYGREGPKVDAL